MIIKFFCSVRLPNSISYSGTFSPQSCSTHELAPNPSTYEHIHQIHHIYFPLPTPKKTSEFLPWTDKFCDFTKYNSRRWWLGSGDLGFFFSLPELVVTAIVGTHNVEIANVETCVETFSFLF